MPSIRAGGSEPPSGERTAGCGLVLIHGGWPTAACWPPTITALASRAPTLPLVAVDLPGRGSTPGDLRSLTLEQCVDSVIDQVERANLEEVVVAHSRGGLSAPRVVARLAARRVRRLVLIVAVVPPEGRRMLDLIPLPARGAAAWFFRDGAPPRRPPRRLFARWWFGNDLSST